MTGPGGFRPGDVPEHGWGGAAGSRHVETAGSRHVETAGSRHVETRGRARHGDEADWYRSDTDRVERERRARWDAEPRDERAHGRGGRSSTRQATAAPAVGPLRASRDPLHSDRGRARQATRPPRAAVRKQSRVGRFVSAYGWRAYAVPVLAVVTVLAVVDVARTPTAAPVSPPALASSDADPGLGPQQPVGSAPTIIGAPAGDGSFDPATPSGALPDGGPFAATGDGSYRVVPGTTEQVGQGTQQVDTYTVEVENGVDTSGFGGDEAFGALVDATLANPKSWAGDPRFAFRRVDSGTPTFRISLTSQTTVREACGYTIELEGSCYNSGIGRVVINEPRWVRGAVAFQGDIGSYRQYVTNHEVGHAIGFNHQACESDGGLAPVMMQQTYGVANDDVAALDPDGVVPANGFVCRFNPWPFPRA